jgi:hypothetical protein
VPEQQLDTMTDSGGTTTDITISVSDHDNLPAVLDQVRAARGKSIRLEIPDHSPVFLTATEFRTLRDMAESNDVTVTLGTSDPLRLQLASMFGLADVERPARPDDNGETDHELESTPSFRGWRGARGQQAGSAEEVAAEDPISVSRRRRTDLYDHPAPDRTSRNVGLSEDATFVSLSYLDEDPGARKAQFIGRVVAVVLVAALVLLIAGWYYMPAVTVQANLRQGQIRTELLYSVTAPGAAAAPDAAFSVEASELSDTVEFDIVVPATGTQSTPDKSATGVVTLRNASEEPVTVPAGTSLTTVAGATFVTDADVEVPGGSADGSTIGEATVNVTASEPGASGNLGPGELSGKVGDLPVYFSNLGQEMAGGTDIEVAVVTEEDIANAELQLENDINRVVAEDWTATLPEGQVILIPSVDAGDPEFTIEQEPGDVSDTVTLRGTADATGFQYNRESVREQALEFYSTALGEEVPEGYELVDGTVQLGEPVLVAQSPASVEYTMEATATVRAIFTGDDQDQLVEDLSGKDEGEAEAILANIPAFDSWLLESSPSWWPGGLPRATGRISLDLSDEVVDVSTPEVPPEASPAAVGGS